MQMKSTLAIALVLGLVGCTHSPTSIPLRPGVASCGTQHGLTGLHVYLRTDQWRDYGAGLGGSSPVTGTTIQRLPRNDAGMNDASLRFPQAFPSEKVQIESGRRLGFPAAYSPDKQSFAAAVVNENSGTAPTRLLVRVGQSSRILESQHGFSFYTFTWSPDSRRLAALERNYDPTPRSLRTFISPHRADYSDAVLTVIDQSGTIVCQAPLAAKELELGASIEWRRE